MAAASRTDKFLRKSFQMCIDQNPLKFAPKWNNNVLWSLHTNIPSKYIAEIHCRVVYLAVADLTAAIVIINAACFHKELYISSFYRCGTNPQCE